MNNNPNIDKDKWLESFKDSLSDYSTPTPKNGWERVNSSISKQKKIASFKKITATILSSAAAILLLFLLINRGEETQIDNKLASNSKPSIEVIDNILNEDKEDNEKVKESNKDKYNRIDNKNYNNKPYIGNQNTSKTNKTIQPIIPAHIDTSNNINNIHNSTDTLEITDYIATNNIINKQKEEIDNRLSWDEYLKQEEADKIKVANNKNRTLLAIAAGSNGISNTSNTTNNNLRQNSPDISLGYISSYYNPYMEYTHKQPISFGVYFGKNIKNFSIETGITYTY